MLTPADVEQKTFSTALRGYDLDEVDDFLDEIVATLRELTEQLEEARSGQPVPAAAPAPVPEPEPEPEPEVVAEPEVAAVPAAPAVDETAIGRALIAAQTAADQLLVEARSEADRLVEEAKSEADSWTEERDAKKREAEAQIAAFAERVTAVRSELSVLASEVAVKLDDMDEVIAGAGDTDTSVGPEGLDADEAEVVVDGDDDDHGYDRSEDGYGSPEQSLDSADSDEDDSDGVENEAGNGHAHVDEMLSGVVTDLRLRDDDGESSLSDDGDDDGDGDDDPNDEGHRGNHIQH